MLYWTQSHHHVALMQHIWSQYDVCNGCNRRRTNQRDKCQCTRKNCLLQVICLERAKLFVRNHPAPCRQVAKHCQGLERCFSCNEILHSLKSIAIQLQEYNPVMFYHLPLLPSFLRAPKVFLHLLFDIWLKE